MTSDLGLHCLPVTLVRVSRLKWDKLQEHTVCKGRVYSGSAGQGLMPVAVSKNC